MVDSFDENRNLFYQNQSEILATQVALERATRELNLSLKQTTRQLANRFTGFINPIVRLEDSIRRMDETNRRALQLGTTTQKLSDNVSKNTDVLNRGNVSTQKLLNAFTNYFEQGVRDQSGAIGDLTEVMIATGQDTTGLGKQLSDLALMTGGNTEVLKRTAKANLDIADKYGISNERLIASVNSLRNSFDAASFFGPEATAGLEALTYELKGRAGGTNVEPALRTLFRLITPGEQGIAPATMLGAMGARRRMGANQAVGMDAIQNIFDRVLEIDKISRSSGDPNFQLIRARGMAGGLSGEEFVQLRQLALISQRDFQLQESMRSTDQETFGSLKNIEERSVNFFDNTALSMLGFLSVAAAGISQLVSLSFAGGALAGLRPMTMPGNPKTVGNALTRNLKHYGGKLMTGGGLGTVAALGGTALTAYGGESKTASVAGRGLQGLGFGMMTGNPIAAVGAGIAGVLYGIYENTGNTAEELEKTRMEQERKNRQQEAAAADQVSKLTYFAEYLRRNTNETRTSDPALREIVTQLLVETTKLRMATEESTSTGPTALPK